MKLRLLSKDDVQRALPMRPCIEAMKDAFAQLSTGQANVPLRTVLPVPAHDGTTLFMPAHLRRSGALGAKIVFVFPTNASRGLPTVHALVVLVDGATGVPLALIDGTYLTALRTGGASGAATDILARPDARVAAIFGAGTQARTQLEAVCAVRSIARAFVYDRNPDRAAQFAAELSARGAPFPFAIRPTTSPEEALREADVVCTATTSSTPVFAGAQLRPGTHVNAIGAFTPRMQEVDADTVCRAKVVIDSRLASLAEAGDLIIPIQQGLIGPSHVHAELGEIVAGLKPGRETPDEITLFKSVGVAVQDVAAARLVLQEAERQGLGVVVDL